MRRCAASGERARRSFPPDPADSRRATRSGALPAARAARSRLRVEAKPGQAARRVGYGAREQPRRRGRMRVIAPRAPLGAPRARRSRRPPSDIGSGRRASRSRGNSRPGCAAGSLTLTFRVDRESRDRPRVAGSHGDRESWNHPVLPGPAPRARQPMLAQGRSRRSLPLGSGGVVSVGRWADRGQIQFRALEAAAERRRRPSAARCFQTGVKVQQ